MKTKYQVVVKEDIHGGRVWTPVDNKVESEIIIGSRSELEKFETMCWNKAVKMEREYKGSEMFKLEVDFGNGTSLLFKSIWGKGEAWGKFVKNGKILTESDVREVFGFVVDRKKTARKYKALTKLGITELEKKLKSAVKKQKQVGYSHLTVFYLDDPECEFGIIQYLSISLDGKLYALLSYDDYEEDFLFSEVIKGKVKSSVHKDKFGRGHEFEIDRDNLIYNLAYTLLMIK